MRNKFIWISSVVIIALAASVVFIHERNSMDDFFYANVDALARGEAHTVGTCDRTTSSECMGICPGCGQLVYAAGYYGKARVNSCKNH